MHPIEADLNAASHRVLAGQAPARTVNIHATHDSKHTRAAAAATTAAAASKQANKQAGRLSEFRQEKSANEA